MDEKRLPKTTALGLVNTPRAAEMLGLAEQTVRQMTCRRELPFIKIGRLVFFDPTDLESFARSRRVEPVGAGK